MPLRNLPQEMPVKDPAFLRQPILQPPTESSTASTRRMERRETLNVSATTYSGIPIGSGYHSPEKSGRAANASHLRHAGDGRHLLVTDRGP